MSVLEYVSLHTHSDASADGAGTVPTLVGAAVKLGMKALALTDHGSLANAVAFWSSCTDNGIKPILGMEAYLLYQGERCHITLLSLNEDGFNNLVQLDTEAHTHGFSSGYPLVTMNNLEQYAKGIYALTGCPSSAFYKGDDNDATKYVSELVDIYGVGGVGIECMFVGTHDAWTRPAFISRRLNLPFVITNDTHYPYQHQHKAHQTICMARHGFTYNSEHLWLKSGEEIYREASNYTDAHTIAGGLHNSILIANRVDSWDMKRKPTLPYIANVEVQIEAAVRSGLKIDIATKGQKEIRLDRVRRELKVLQSRGFLDYIYILWDIVSWARQQGISVGPGRGSGGGSYVLYLLGITGIDPIEHGLMFERFLNPARNDYPDIDTDFESERRGEVMNYAHDKWGTIPIATYSCYSHKSAIHDIARVLTIPKDLEIPAAESAMDSQQVEDFMAAHPDAPSTYVTMLGQIRHRGKHAAGVIIPNRPVPIERQGDELVAAWAEGMNTKDLSKVGIVKYDILGLTALSQLKRMQELTGELPPETLTDAAIYDLFCNGDVSGIFQWSGSDGIRELTQKVAPRNFYDLTTCNALYRPGALDAGTAEHYPEFMLAPRKLHPRLDPILEKTYGVLCYQEQVMGIVAEMMGGDLSQADLARRLLSKAAIGDPAWEKAIEELYLSFGLAAEKQGFSPALIGQMWGEIYKHSGYSYNLSHATAYTLISYRMAWYKVYHRPAFVASVLQYDKANAQTYILDAVASGLRIEMPTVNFSNQGYNLVGSTLYLPLSDVAFLGDKGCEFIIQDVLANGIYPSYEEFERRTPKKLVNSRARAMLERIGAFEGLSGNPASAIKDYSNLPILSTYQNQLEILGYVVPDQVLLQKMQLLANRPAKKGYLSYAGFISEVKKKKSVHGEYVVYNLSPSGSFWIRGEAQERYKVGVFVAGSKSKFGHSNDAKIYRMGTK